MDPGAPRWTFDVASAAPGEDWLGTGGDLDPATLLEAYRCGAFPMPAGRRGAGVDWWSPDPRGILPLDGLRVSRSLRRARRRYRVTVDQAYDEVVAACADPSRPDGWIDHRITSAYRRLHELGWVHSVETWAVGEDGEERLAGGLYGVAVGGLFAGESMFFAERDASKVALVALVEMLHEAGGRRLIDVQWATPHLRSLGAVAVPRAVYLQLLARALALPLPRLSTGAP